MFPDDLYTKVRYFYSIYIIRKKERNMKKFAIAALVVAYAHSSVFVHTFLFSIKINLKDRQVYKLISHKGR